MEAHRLRIKDIVLERGEVIVRDAKGGKDRVTVLPVAIVGPIICWRPAATSARYRNCWATPM
jgi:hypothetical protein